MRNKIDSNKQSNNTNANNQTSNAPTSSRANGPSDGTINFNKRGPPVFQKRNKGIMDTQNFPDMADAAAGGSTSNRNNADTGG